MHRHIYQVDSNGFIEEVFLGQFDETGELIDPIGEYVTTDLPQPLPFYRPKWNGSKWIEGATKEELEKHKEQQLLDDLIPSVEEIKDADLEIKILTMLLEMEVKE